MATRGSDPLVFVGGTGPAGRGLALRFAAAGVPVLVGSRDHRRALATAAAIRAAVADADVDGAENLDAIRRSRRVVLSLPACALDAFLATAGRHLDGKLVVDLVVPLAFSHGFATIVPLPGAASAGEFVAARVPAAQVVSAFKNLPAEVLGDLDRPLKGDVVLCGDDADARTEVAWLVERIGLRAVDAGALANARYLEAITALLVNLNRRHKSRATIAILGLGTRR